MTNKEIVKKVKSYLNAENYAAYETYINTLGEVEKEQLMLALEADMYGQFGLEQPGEISFTTHKVQMDGHHPLMLPWIVCEERKALVDRHFDWHIERIKLTFGSIDNFFSELDSENKIAQGNLSRVFEGIKSAYILLYSKDRYYTEQLDTLIKKKLARLKTRKVDNRELVLDYFFAESLHLFKVSTKKGKEQQRQYVIDGLIDNFYYNEADNENFKKSEEYLELLSFVEKVIKRKARNFNKRLRLFRQKAQLNNFNYFATITMNDKIFNPTGELTKVQAEEVFREKLLRTLANNADRKGWKQMGVFEYGRGYCEKDNLCKYCQSVGYHKGRLHFHMLVYVPTGQMMSELKPTKKRYDPVRRRKTQRLECAFFKKAYGINDWQHIVEVDISLKNLNNPLVNYILKYMTKATESTVYSRGLPAHLIKDISQKQFKLPVYYRNSETIKSFILSHEVITDEDIKNVRTKGNPKKKKQEPLLLSKPKTQITFKQMIDFGRLPEPVPLPAKKAEVIEQITFVM
ncbi:MAG: hypothetical protein FWB72_01725 [Firmicutes bacterium]|nr:hypothetical protein [Bacillota bacterium]